MRRVPPHSPEVQPPPKRRLQHLQLLLLVALALWSINGGVDGNSEVDGNAGADRVADAASGSVADVSSGLEPFLEIELVSTLTPKLGFDGRGLARLLRHVNPSLTRGEVDRIAAAVIRYSAKYDLDPDLVTAVLLVESSARPWVRSPKGAVGLMQVMPHMMKPLQLAGNAATIESNIEAGCWILASNIRRLGEEEGISSYFWGSQIRSLAYLEKVQAAREEVRRNRPS